MKRRLLGIAMAMGIAAVGVASAAPMKGAAWVPIVSAQLSPQQRHVIVDQIVRKWGPFVESVHKTSGSAWAKRMGATFAAANDANLQRAAGMKTFQGMMDALTGQQVSDARVMDSLATQAQVLGSTPHQALLGSTASDLVYTPLAPCRIADTRNVGGVVQHGTFVSFKGSNPGGNFAFQGGNASSDCGIPASPSALMINVAAPVSTQGGYLTVWPFGTTMPLASNLDYKAGDLANNEIAAKMSTGMASDFSVFAFGTTNIVVDVVGYFMAPNATAVDCTIVSSALPPSTVIVPNTGHAVEADTPTCPATYTLVSTNCTMATDVGVINTVATGVSSGAIGVCWGLSSVPDQLTAQGVCCRVPGR